MNRQNKKKKKKVQIKQIIQKLNEILLNNNKTDKKKVIVKHNNNPRQTHNNLHQHLSKLPSVNSNNILDKEEHKEELDKISTCLVVQVRNSIIRIKINGLWVNQVKLMYKYKV